MKSVLLPPVKFNMAAAAICLNFVNKSLLLNGLRYEVETTYMQIKVGTLYVLNMPELLGAR